ncbi:MAG: hypothetical protein ACLP5H_02665, partial [Desulfomonilaceae bacterium]
RTASSRNSLEYRPWGILALSIVTPPSHLSIKHWCPSFSTYPIAFLNPKDVAEASEKAGVLDFEWHIVESLELENA